MIRQVALSRGFKFSRLDHACAIISCGIISSMPCLFLGYRMVDGSMMQTIERSMRMYEASRQVCVWRFCRLVFGVLPCCCFGERC